MKKRTRLLQFDKATTQKIIIRDQYCVFCKLGFHMENKDVFQYQIKDIMHVVNKSQGGLGIEENGVLGCRYHHSLLDNGNKGLRNEMIHILGGYLKNLYPGWDKSNLIYKKYG